MQVLLCFLIIAWIHVITAGDHCDEFTIQVNDPAIIKMFPMDSPLTSYINATDEDMSSCKFLQVYIELDQPTCGNESQKIIFALHLNDEPAVKESLVSAGVIAGSVLGTAGVAVAGYFGYSALMNFLKSGVYRLPPSGDLLQFKAL